MLVSGRVTMLMLKLTRCHLMPLMLDNLLFLYSYRRWDAVTWELSNSTRMKSIKLTLKWDALHENFIAKFVYVEDPVRSYKELKVVELVGVLRNLSMLTKTHKHEWPPSVPKTSPLGSLWMLSMRLWNDNNTH